MVNWFYETLTFPKENQAIDRVHRFGQTREVEVHRICIGESVEDRIRELQARKQEVADAVLDEGGRTSSGRLGLNDLMMLFNVNHIEDDD